MSICILSICWANILLSIPGTYCERDVDECQATPNLCQNGGTCQNLPGSFICVCVNGWNGTYCQTNIDDCGPINPCYNGGTCIDRVGYYQCQCPQGKTGTIPWNASKRFTYSRWFNKYKIVGNLAFNLSNFNRKESLK